MIFRSKFVLMKDKSTAVLFSKKSAEGFCHTYVRIPPHFSMRQSRKLTLF